MAKVLIDASHGPEDPTKAVLPFFVARNALELGHEVTLFLLGDATGLLRDSVIETVVGVGPGALKDHFPAVRDGGATIYL
jgi:predicted peroxiredoxin